MARTQRSLGRNQQEECPLDEEEREPVLVHLQLSTPRQRPLASCYRHLQQQSVLRDQPAEAAVVVELVAEAVPVLFPDLSYHDVQVLQTRNQPGYAVHP